MMGRVYKGRGWSRTQVGEYEKGYIYAGRGWSRTQIGEYDDENGGAASALLLLFLES